MIEICFLPHAFEMFTITFFTTLHNPHCWPLSNENGLNNSWNVIDKCNCRSDVIKNWNFSNLLPRHWHWFQNFVDCMWNEFEGTKIDSFVLSEFLVWHVSMILYKFSEMFWGHLIFLLFNITELFLFAVTFTVQLTPFSSLKKKILCEIKKRWITK